MLETSIKYHFNFLDFPLLKQSAEFCLRNIKSPSHRLETLARWCGFNTLAGLKAALEAAEGNDVYFHLNPAAAISYAASRDVLFDSFSGHQCLGAAAQVKTAKNYPELHEGGYGSNSFYISDYERREIRLISEKYEFQRTIFLTKKKRYELSRQTQLEIRDSSQFLRALALCSHLTPIKSINKNISSYNLKHRAEERSFILQGGVALSKDYVSNSSFIAAAFFSGFSCNLESRSNSENPNLSFNISQRSLNDITTRFPKEN